MDRHVRWLRRVVVAGVLTRLAVECAVVAVAVSAAAIALGAGTVVALMMALGSIQLLAVIRVAVAVTTNPVNYSYLCGFKDTSHLLEPMSSTGEDHGPHEADLAERGLSYLETLGQPNTDHMIDFFVAPSRMVVAATGPDGHPMVVLSRMSDGRTLISSPELVPPHSMLLVNQHRGATVADLVDHHLERLTDLANNEITPVVTDRTALTDQLRLEWEAWDQMGPFLGPLINVGGGKGLARLQVRVDEQALWERATIVEATPEATPKAASAKPPAALAGPGAVATSTPPASAQPTPSPAVASSTTPTQPGPTHAAPSPAFAAEPPAPRTAVARPMPAAAGQPDVTPAAVTQSMATLAAAAQDLATQPLASHNIAPQPPAPQPMAPQEPAAQPPAAEPAAWQSVASQEPATPPPSTKSLLRPTPVSEQAGAALASPPTVAHTDIPTPPYFDSAPTPPPSSDFPTAPQPAPPPQPIAAPTSLPATDFDNTPQPTPPPQPIAAPTAADYDTTPQPTPPTLAPTPPTPAGLGTTPPPQPIPAPTAADYDTTPQPTPPPTPAPTPPTPAGLGTAPPPQPIAGPTPADFETAPHPTPPPQPIAAPTAADFGVAPPVQVHRPAMAEAAYTTRDIDAPSPALAALLSQTAKDREAAPEPLPPPQWATRPRRRATDRQS